MTLFFFWILVLVSSKTLQEIIETKEKMVEDICEGVRKYYFEPEISGECEKFWACDENLKTAIENNGGSMICEQGYGEEDNLNCGGGCNGKAEISFTHPAVRYAPGTAPGSSSIDSTTSKKIAEFACFTQSLKFIFKENHETDLNQTWTYIGSPEGVFQMYPGSSILYQQPSESDTCKIKQSTCPDYDPRIRPWYVNSASGPKDVVMILDVSGSMSGKRMNLLKDAAKTVIDGFSIYDRISIVSFSSAAQTLTGNYDLIRGTVKNKEYLSNLVDSMNADGNTNFYSGFVEAFKIFDQKSYNPGLCHNSIIFLTDGESNLGLEGDDLLNYIAEKNTNDLRAKIFTFSLGDDASTTLPKKIACANNGVWLPVDDDSTVALRTKLTNYYNYFINSNNTRQSVWSEMYFDFSGAGQMTTVSKGCFDSKNNFYGVAGADVLISEFDGYGYNFTTDVFPILFEKSNKCFDIDMTEEELENLREYKCTDSPSQFNISSVFITIGIVLGIVVFVSIVAMIFLVIYYCFKDSY